MNAIIHCTIYPHLVKLKKRPYASNRNLAVLEFAGWLIFYKTTTALACRLQNEVLIPNNENIILLSLVNVILSTSKMSSCGLWYDGKLYFMSKNNFVRWIRRSQTRSAIIVFNLIPLHYVIKYCLSAYHYCFPFPILFILSLWAFAHQNISIHSSNFSLICVTRCLQHN